MFGRTRGRQPARASTAGEPRAAQPGARALGSRPRRLHAYAADVLGRDLGQAYDWGRGGPGGWWILVEPGVALADHDIDEIVPDLAGWRRERLETWPSDGPIALVPDWVCEVVTAATRHHDLRSMRPLYARLGVRHMWLVDAEARVVTASRLEDGRWLELGVWGDDDHARLDPFDGVELALADLWAEARISRP